MLTRVLLPLLPEAAVHRLKKSYYAYVITHSPETWIERDACIAGALISPGDVVLDIGASLGVFTRYLSRSVGPNGKVYALEPIPQTFEFLTNNVQKLRLNNVEALNFAASDAERTDTMVIPNYRWGSECWYDAQIKTENTNPAWRAIEVKTRTVDGFFSEHLPSARISFIKCDANTHEFAVLKGAMRTIQKSMPAMLIEIFGDPDDPATRAFATFDLLRNAGFDPYWFNGNSLVPRQRGERSQNYFFLTKQQADTLSAAELAFGTFHSRAAGQ